MRYFEKISFEQFKKDVCDDKELYDKIELPARGTRYSAGYDFKSVESGVIPPHSSMIFKTGIKAAMNEDEVLYLFVRGSMGFKYDVGLSNMVGVVDADFYNNPENEGHIAFKLFNHGDKEYVVNIGDRVGQGVFMKYLTVDDEKQVTRKRTGGFGSTNKKE